MTQLARPNADVVTGGWAPTPLYVQINEPTPDDTNYVSSPSLPTGGTFIDQLDPLARPVTGQHTLTVRMCVSEPVAVIVTFQLLYGCGTIASPFVVITTEFVNY